MNISKSRQYFLLMLVLAIITMGTRIPTARAIFLSDPNTPPEAIGNLTIPYFTTTSATLRFTVATSDIDATSTYDIRYSNAPIHSENFSNAKIVAIAPIMAKDLHVNDTERTYTVEKLTPGMTYYFALKSKFQNTLWSEISDVPSIAIPAFAPISSTFPNMDLHYGQRSESVADLQKFLTTQKLYTGPISMYFGPLTQKAVIAFQQKNTIVPALGYVGPLTRSAIKKAMAEIK